MEKADPSTHWTNTLYSAKVNFIYEKEGQPIENAYIFVVHTHFAFGLECRTRAGAILVCDVGVNFAQGAFSVSLYLSISGAFASLQVFARKPLEARRG